MVKVIKQSEKKYRDRCFGCKSMLEYSVSDFEYDDYGPFIRCPKCGYLVDPEDYITSGDPEDYSLK